MTRLLIFVGLLVGCLGGVGYIFYQQELQFIGPTPIPENYLAVNQGDSIDIKSLDFPSEKPLFVHFYNYHCPCSRFNAKEFTSMVHQYGSEVNFVAVVQTSDEDEDVVDKFKNKYDLGIPVIHDKTGKYAQELGVYSTPQAVIINNSKIFYRGNYNKARFCTTKNTKFAEIALHALLNDQAPPDFPLVAEIAYGCELPSNGNQKSALFDFF